MEKLQETKRWNEWKDKIAEEEYKRSFVDNGVRTNNKERLLNKVIYKKGHTKSYWDKCKVKQLVGILNS